MRRDIQAVLFDLDGTLIDSAPDLAGAANALRVQHGLPHLPYEQLRPMVGAGARGMVGLAFGVGPGEPPFEALRDAFLAQYESALLVHTHVFADMLPVLAALHHSHCPWGIVTNKNSRFAQPVVLGLPALSASGVLICGDTTPHAKPHPEPLLEAARRLAVPAKACVYVGDDLRDIQAGQAAGMRTIAAGWGYLGQGEHIEDWGADFIAQQPADLLNWLEQA